MFEDFYCEQIIKLELKGFNNKKIKKNIGLLELRLTYSFVLYIILIILCYGFFLCFLLNLNHILEQRSENNIIKIPLCHY